MQASGSTHRVESGDVNDYLRELSGESVAVKDFRTWGASTACYQLLCDLGTPSTTAEASRMIAIAVKLVASRLGNTPAVCRASYIHPVLLERSADRTLPLDLGVEWEADQGLRADEQRMLLLLERELESFPETSAG